MRKKCDWEKIPYLFRISWNFLGTSWTNLLDILYGSLSQVMVPFFCLSKPISPMCFLTDCHRSWVRRPTTWLIMLLKMVQNCSMGQCHIIILLFETLQFWFKWNFYKINQFWATAPMKIENLKNHDGTKKIAKK